MNRLVPKAFAGTLGVEHDGLRLDQAVQALAGLSRREARVAIACGQVVLGRRVCRIVARPVAAGQALSVRLGEKAANEPTSALPAQAAAASLRPSGELAVLWLDAQVVAVDKPAGLLSEADRFGAPSVESVLPKVLQARGERPEVWLVHRLDAGTSGVLLLARSRQAARALSAQFRARQVDKEYWAICQGSVQGAKTVHAALTRKRGVAQGVVDASHPEAKAATTAFLPLAVGPTASLVRAKPLTGRSHQIRVHLQHLGHPIVGDGLYGGPRYATPSAGTGERAAVARPLLHALSLSLAHPKVGAPRLELLAPPPADFLTIAKHLGLSLPTWPSPAQPAPSAVKRARGRPSSRAPEGRRPRRK